MEARLVNLKSTACVFLSYRRWAMSVVALSALVEQLKPHIFWGGNILHIFMICTQSIRQNSFLLLAVSVYFVCLRADWGAESLWTVRIMSCMNILFSLTSHSPHVLIFIRLLFISCFFNCFSRRSGAESLWTVCWYWFSNSGVDGRRGGLPWVTPIWRLTRCGWLTFFYSSPI